jgi:transposase
MLRDTCQECERLLREFDEIVQKSFRVEERLRLAKNCHYHALAKDLAVRLAHFADERVRLNSLLIEHEAQGQDARHFSTIPSLSPGWMNAVHFQPCKSSSGRPTYLSHV